MFQFVLVIYHGDDGDVDGSGHHGNNRDNLDSYHTYIYIYNSATRVTPSNCSFREVNWYGLNALTLDINSCARLYWFDKCSQLRDVLHERRNCAIGLSMRLLQSSKLIRITWLWLFTPCLPLRSTTWIAEVCVHRPHKSNKQAVHCHHGWTRSTGMTQ